MNSSRLIRQPVELLQAILVLLHPLDIVHCRQVSKRMKELIDSSLRLNLIIDLYEEGLLFRPDYVQGSMENESNYFARYKELLHQMKLHHVAFLPTKFLPPDSQRFSQNYIAYCEGSDITFTDVNPPGSTHTLQDIYQNDDVSPVNFMFKPSDDLLICVYKTWSGIEIDTRTISTGLPHPLAAESTMTVKLPDVKLIRFDLIQDRLVLLARTTGYHLIYFNWKVESQATVTTIQFDSYTEAKHALNIVQISALTVDFMLLCSYTGSTDGSPSILVYSIPQQKIVYRLNLSVINREQRLLLFSPCSLPDDRSSFRYRQDDTLNIIVMAIERLDERAVEDFLVLSKAGILNLVAEVPSNANCVELYWDEWANGISAWISERMELERRGEQFAYGHMVCLKNLYRTPLGQHAQRNVLFNFNPRPARRRLPTYSGALRSAFQIPYRVFMNEAETDSHDFVLGGDFLVEELPKGYDVFSLFPDDQREQRGYTG